MRRERERSHLFAVFMQSSILWRRGGHRGTMAKIFTVGPNVYCWTECVCVCNFPIWCQCLTELKHAVVWNCNSPHGENDLCLNLDLHHLRASCWFVQI